MYMGYIMKRNSWKVVFNAAMGYILDTRIFEADLQFQELPKQLANKSAVTSLRQYSVTLKKGKEIFQSAREFTFCLLQTILIMIIKPFKFIGMAKLQKILQKINVPFYIDSTMFCSSHVSDCSCGHFDLRKGF